MRKRLNTYLAIPITTCCNYQCFYCKEGVFSMFLSSNLPLHLSGCKNKSIHFDLNGCDDEQMKKAFNKLLDIMED